MRLLSVLLLKLLEILQVQDPVTAHAMPLWPHPSSLALLAMRTACKCVKISEFAKIEDGQMKSYEDACLVRMSRVWNHASRYAPLFGTWV